MGRHRGSGVRRAGMLVLVALCSCATAAREAPDEETTLDAADLPIAEATDARGEAAAEAVTDDLARIPFAPLTVTLDAKVVTPVTEPPEKEAVIPVKWLPSPKKAFAVTELPTMVRKGSVALEATTFDGSVPATTFPGTRPVTPVPMPLKKPAPSVPLTVTLDRKVWVAFQPLSTLL